MASFDYETFIKAIGKQGKGAYEALGMSFGIPNCILSFGKDVLQLLPSDILGNMNGELLSAKSKADEITKEVIKKLMLNTGILEFDTDEGILKFVSDTSKHGIDKNEAGLLDNIQGFAKSLAYGLEVGANIFNNLDGVMDQMKALKECFDKYKTIKEFESGSSADHKAGDLFDNLFDQEYNFGIYKLKQVSIFTSAVDNVLLGINDILLARYNNLEKEPTFSDASELDPFLINTTLRRGPKQDPNLDPRVAAEGRIDPITGRPYDEVFRLVYGPPISIKGQFILSKDGLYYDSQKGGVDTALISIIDTVSPANKWMFNYDPNIGGKGNLISTKDIDLFTGTMFDLDIIDDSSSMSTYYEADHFLQVLMGQRDKHIYDLSGQLNKLIVSEGVDSAIVQNMKQVIYGEIDNHTHKINRRKKQIEIAIKAPIYYGGKKESFRAGTIPINDFSYLNEYNFAPELAKQQKLMIHEAEVSGAVLPIRPKFVKSYQKKTAGVSTEHLLVPEVGKGGIIYSASGDQGGTILSLTDNIATRGLFAIYNFLNSDVALASSINYKIRNCATLGTYNNGKLVSPNASSVFVSGLGIPYLHGITKNKNYTTSSASGLGSFVMLPDTKEFRDLTYSRNGFTFECWVHVPNMDDITKSWGSNTGDVSSLTKCILACENVGLTSSFVGTPSEDLDYLPNSFSESKVRGLIIGFTRDRRMTGNIGFNNGNGTTDVANNPDKGMFIVAPTLSRDASALSWINNTGDCPSGFGYYGVRVPLSSLGSHGYGMNSVSSNFCQLAVTVSPGNDNISIYLDGVLMATSSIRASFGIPDFTPLIKTPSFKANNSFNYAASTTDGPLTIQNGPQLNTFFTPWILGGGYTDGMAYQGNFMGGGARGGLQSGLRGYIGSVKFYKEALHGSEIMKNYKAQLGFFKYIIT